jgi:outer membrane murein-binding lipoprotein Lpp
VSASRKAMTKPAAKKVPAKKVAKKAPPRLLVAKKVVAQAPANQTFSMPTEVKEWIDRANSTIQHLKSKVDRLETENKELKAYQKFAEQRILRSEHE